MSTQKRHSKPDRKHLDHHAPSRLFPPSDEASEIMVACRRSDYSASAIARAVEDCDAHLINLNITADPAPDGSDDLVVELRISHRNAMGVARSLERYGFRVLLTRHGRATRDDHFTSELVEPAVDRVRSLLAQIDV